MVESGVAAVGTEAGETAGRLDLRSGSLIGRVTRLDRNRLEVELSEPGLAARVTVSDLVALPTGSDFLIGLVEAVHMRPARNPGVALQVMPVGRLSPGEGVGDAAFRRGASGYPHVGSACHLVEGEQLHRFMSLLGRGVAPEEQLVLGRYAADRETEAIADGNRFFQRHLALIGSTGAGKSWAVALMLERASRLSHPNLLVLDLHGEYTPLTHRSGVTTPIARGLRVAGPADVARPSDDVLFLPHWLLERDELMALVLNPDDPDAADHVFRFTEHVQTLKRVSLVDQGRSLALATFTVDSPIPYRLEHLVELLRRDDLEKIPQPPSNRIEPGPYFGRLTSFISRLEARAGDPRYGFIFDPPEQTFGYGWLGETAAKLLGAGTKIVDLSEVPSAIVPLVAGVLARLVYDIQFWMDPARRTPVCLVCDEAHLYLPTREDSGPIHRAALEVFEAIAKEGRKHGVGLVVVTQRPTDVSSTILSQCNNFVVMRLTNDHDRAMVERLIPEHLAGVTGVLPALEPGEGVVVGDALLLPTRVEFDPPDVKPAGTTQPYWSLWAERPSSDEAIADGVEALRNQLRASG
jgi:DNA helicase HerA-like ATPase